MARQEEPRRRSRLPVLDTYGEARVDKSVKEVVDQLDREDRGRKVSPQDLRKFLATRRLRTLEQAEQAAHDPEDATARDRRVVGLVFRIAFVALVVGVVLLTLELAYWAVMALLLFFTMSFVAALTWFAARLPRLQRALGFTRDPAGYLQSSLTALLAPQARNYINDRSESKTPGETKTVAVEDASGLSELSDSSLHVSTANAKKARATLGGIHGGSLGLAGPRGAGKTMLLTVMSAGQVGRFRPDARVQVGAVVGAPVRYQAAEFVAYLHSELCLAVLRGRDPDERDPRRSWLFTVLLVSAGVVLVLVGVALYRHAPSLNTPAHVIVGDLLALAGLLSICAAVWRAVWRLLREYDEPTSAGYVARRAREDLHELRNIDTVTRALSGQLSGFGRVGLTGLRQRASARQPAGLPELVRRYKRFVQLLTARGTVVIGIDELDKMSDDDARLFLGDVKTLFGLRDCYYLVSVSEDAMSAFQRRGTPFRDEFDSSFDAVLRVEPLRAHESRRVLQRRVVGLGVGAQMLCHALSGGLPRDLIRAARDLVDATAGRPVNLDKLLWPVVIQRVREAHDAAWALARPAVGDDGDHPLMRWLRARERALDEYDERALEACWSVAPLLGDNGERHEVGLVALQLSVVAYHALSTVQLFSKLTDTDLRLLRKYLIDLECDAAEPQPDGTPAGAARSAPACHRALELLALARRDMALAPALAWRTVSAARAEASLTSPAQAVPFPGRARRRRRRQPFAAGRLLRVVISRAR